MKEHIKNIIASEGEDILANKRLIYMLDDYNAFKNQPKPIRRMMVDVIENGYALKLTRLKVWSIEANNIFNHYTTNFGVKEEFARIIFNAIAYGLNLNTVDAVEKVDKDKTRLENKQNIGQAKICYSIKTKCVCINNYNSNENLQTFKVFDAMAMFNMIIFKFSINNFDRERHYYFHYNIFNFENNVIENKSIKLDNQILGIRYIDKCCIGISPNEISKIEYYLTC